MHTEPKQESGNLDLCEQVARIDDWIGRIHARSREPRLSTPHVVFAIAGGATAFFLAGMLIARLLMT